MKGVKYNLQFKKPNDEIIELNFLKMDELENEIKKHFMSNYFIEPKINHHIIYNLQKRPLTASKLLRDKVKIEKIVI
tara:strand:- start:1047 stop:1277 length:231 start_codon:yes stop_codon:yes gene_type:complete